jgi:hypothetical protein
MGGYIWFLGVDLGPDVAAQHRLSAPPCAVWDLWGPASTANGAPVPQQTLEIVKRHLKPNPAVR